MKTCAKIFLWDKTNDFIRGITNNWSNYNEKYMKIIFNSDDDLPLKKIIELHYTGLRWMFV